MSQPVSAQRVIEDLRVELFRKRISQERIAIETGMSQSAIGRRLKGDVAPTLGEVETIANAIGYDLQISLVERTPTATAGAA